jgi:transposase-like protein
MATKPVSQEVIDACVKAVEECGGNIAEAARALGISRSTLQCRVSGKIKRDTIIPKFTPRSLDDDVRAREDRRKRLDEERRHQEALERIAVLERELGVLLQLNEVEQRANPISIEMPKSGPTGESTAFLIASDWHLEERVQPEKVNGLNEFNLQIAEQRATRFFRNGLSLVNINRSGTRIDNLVLALLGDFISGYIHEELVENNEVSPIKAVDRAFEIIAGGIDFLAKNGGFKKIVIPCNVGNHSRTTLKMRCSTSIENSYEWLLYRFLQRHVQCHKYKTKIEFVLPAGYHTFINVYGRNIRFHHGDNVKYQGGIGGVTIPLNKAISAWNQAARADFDVLGHWHTLQSDRHFIINGSLIGYGPYSLKIKAPFEPPMQSFFLLHPKYGRTVEAPIFLQ